MKFLLTASLWFAIYANEGGKKSADRTFIWFDLHALSNEFCFSWPHIMWEILKCRVQVKLASLIYFSFRLFLFLLISRLMGCERGSEFFFFTYRKAWRSVRNYPKPYMLRSFHFHKNRKQRNLKWDFSMYIRRCNSVRGNKWQWWNSRFIPTAWI